MQLMLLTLLLIGSTTLASAEVITCTARTALNQTLTANLDTELMTLAAETNQGHRYQGNVSMYFSPRYGDRIYFLPTGFNQGIEIQLEGRTGDRIALCLSKDSCYRCQKLPPLSSDG